MTLWFPRRLQELLQAPLCFLGTVMIVSTMLPRLVPLRHNDDCFAFHLLHARLSQHVFCKKPLLLSSSSRCHNLGPSVSAYTHCAYPNPVPRILAAPLEVHETTWKCQHFSAWGFPTLFWSTVVDKSSWTLVASRAIHAIYLFVLLRVHHF